MRNIFLLMTIILLLCLPSLAKSADVVKCTIKKKLTTGDSLEAPMVSTETIKIEARPFGDNYVFSLAPAKAECELRINDSNEGSFLNCWTLDKMHGFRSDRTAIDKKRGVENTITYADGEMNVVVQVKVKCK